MASSSEFIMKHLERYSAQKCTRAKNSCYILVGKKIIINARLHNSMNEFNNWEYKTTF